MSRYDLIRRRIAPIAFLLAIALIARDSCEEDQRTHTTVELDFGDARPQVRAVDVDVVAGGATIATFHRAALGDGGIGPCRFAAALPGDDGELRIDVTLGAEHRQLNRRIHALEGGTTYVLLGDALAGPARPR